MTGHRALAEVAPEAAVLLDGLGGARPIGPRRLALVRSACAAVHGLAPLRDHGARPSEDPADEPTAGDDVVVELAERFSADVSAVDDGLRERFVAVCGGRTFETVQAVYLADMVPRARAALDALFGSGDGWPAPRPHEHAAGSWALIEEFIRVVHNLDAVDPVTSEVVRLRGARQHRCRLCQSLRSRPALAAGAGEELWDAIDGPAPRLSPGHRAAVALTDGMIWTPGRLGPDVVADVRSQFTPVQAVELVLDVMRNAANKIAVALGADEAHVTEGIEVYEIDADGTTRYGLDVPAPDPSGR